MNKLKLNTEMKLKILIQKSKYNNRRENNNL